jgi:hypothetical protein
MNIFYPDLVRVMVKPNQDDRIAAEFVDAGQITLLQLKLHKELALHHVLDCSCFSSLHEIRT